MGHGVLREHQAPQSRVRSSREPGSGRGEDHVAGDRESVDIEVSPVVDGADRARERECCRDRVRGPGAVAERDGEVRMTALGGEKP